MSSTAQQSVGIPKMAKRERRPMLSSSDDSAMMKQIQATHAPDGREVDVKPILTVIKDLLHYSTPDIDGIINGKHETIQTLEDKTTVADFDGILDTLAYLIQKVSYEMSCKCSGGGDAHATTMAILNMVSNYSWESKVVISLAAFCVNYGQLWLVVQLFPTNPLAKSVALLKQIPDIIDHANALKSRYDAINNLLIAILEVTNCIVEFKELPSNYISDDKPPMSIAMAHMPTAAYWTIRSMVACMSQVTSLLGMSYEHITSTSSTTEAWEISSLDHKVHNIHDLLKTQLALCYEHIDENRHNEYFDMLVRLFDTAQLDNMKILKALIYSKDDILPLMDGSTHTRVNIEVLRRKIVLLLISDLDISYEEILSLSTIYLESRKSSVNHYEIVWLPIMNRSTPWNEGHQQKFVQLQSMMPWHTLHHPSLLEPAVTRFIKQIWHFEKKPIMVVLDPHGKVVCPNGLHMMWIWGNLAHPFTSAKEDSLWKEESWSFQLLVNGIDQSILDWIVQGKCICLYGGVDIEWIRNFTRRAKIVERAAGITIEMVYVGKKNTNERARKIIGTITTENLSHAWPDLTYIWFFWTRLESMFYSKMQNGKTIESDRIMAEVTTMLSFDGSDQGWVVFSRGTEMAKTKGDTALKSLTEFENWEEDSKQKGFVPALNDYFHKLHTPEHCNRLILPGIPGGIPEKVVCAECGRPMEKFFMYRCCTD